MANIQPTNTEIEKILSQLISPLEAFYQRVEQQPSDTCFVQPVVGGSVVEFDWARVDDEVRRIANYLRALELPEGSHIAIVSKNCAYWIIADLAIWMAGHVSIPIYPTLTADSVRAIMEHSEAKAIFVGVLDLWGDIQKGISDDVLKITFPSSPADAKKFSADWEEILKSTEPMNHSPVPSLDTLATIVYTSGTTGMPKGVMHPFRNMATAGELAKAIYEIDKNDRIISYLPLSHVAERAAVEMPLLYSGFTVYFAFSIPTFADDLRRASPTIFFGVPRIWTKFHQQVIEKIPPKKLELLFKIPLVSMLIKRKIRNAMGLGSVRVAISAAAPLSTSLIEWYGKLGIEIAEAYGMSENMGYSHTTRLGEAVAGYVGRINPAVECIIDKTGEILVRSPTNMMGYYKEPELSSEAIDEEGFLHTGDVGEIDDQGRLKITGRIKEIFKSSKGKYIAPAPVENKLLVNAHIEQVCVTGASLPQPLALINLSESSNKKLENPGFKQTLFAELIQLLDETNAILDQHENLQCLVVVSEEWGIDNGFTTPTLKLKRQKIDEYYSESYDQWCCSSERLIFV